MYTGQPFLEIETTTDNNNNNNNNMMEKENNHNIIKMRKPVLSIVSEPSNAIHVVQRRGRQIPSSSSAAATGEQHNIHNHNEPYIVSSSSTTTTTPVGLVVCNSSSNNKNKKEHNNNNNLPTQYGIENNIRDCYFPDTVDFGMATTPNTSNNIITTPSFTTPTKPPSSTTKPPHHHRNKTHRKTSSLSSVPILSSVYYSSRPPTTQQPLIIRRSGSPGPPSRQRTSSMSSVDVNNIENRPSPPRRTASTKSLFTVTRSLSTKSLNSSSVHSTTTNRSTATNTTTTTTKVASHPIDNTTLTYIPITLPTCGVQTYCSPEVLSSCPMVLQSIQSDLTNIFKLLPWSVHSLIKRTNIWVNATYAYGPSDNPVVLRHSTAHHYEGWLMQVAHDRPEKACSIEIYSCFDYEKMRLHWNGCGLLLHEYCHLIHQFCFGLDNPHINTLYEQATQLSSKYDHVLRRDWAGLQEDYDQAYCTVDQKEFFAEMMVTYLANGYHELDDCCCCTTADDPNTTTTTTMEDCCPILLHPTVIERVMTKYGFENNQDAMMEPTKTHNPFLGLWLLLLDHKKEGNHHHHHQKPKIRMINPVVQESAISRRCLDTKHCNKFYPFTRGQLKAYDHDTYQAFQQLYEEIVMWDDPEDVRHNCRFFHKILPPSHRLR